MKWFMYFLFLLYMAPILTQPQEQFLRANCKYQAHDYQEALSLYQTIPTKGRAVWYNMGNCAYHNKQYLDALVYWTRAEANATWSEYQDIQINKEHVHTILELKQPPKNWIELYILSYIPWKLSWVIAQLFCILAAFLIGVMWYKSRYRLKQLVILCMYILVCAGSYRLYAWYTLQHAPYAYVSDTSLTLYNNPDNRCHEKATIPYGTKVRIIKNQDDWSKVATVHTVGWVKTSSLLIV